MTARSALTPPTAVRIFCGNRRQGLDVDAFRRELGATFMPGTVYMLQPLGLHAYAAAAVDEAVHADAPHETAIIAYPSQATYRAIRYDTLRGRVYSQTHGGVYDPVVSQAAFPTLLTDARDAAAGTIYLFDQVSDLQSGTLTVHALVRSDPAMSGDDFRRRIHAALPELRSVLEDVGALQAFVVLRDVFSVVWTHARDDAAGSAVSQWGTDAGKLVADLTCQRVLCIGEPPVVSVVGNAAFSFVFLRDDHADLGQDA
jgi:hypothetical protein